MNKMTARIARMTTAQIKDAIVEIMTRKVTPEVSMVRAALCDAYEAREGADALDAVLDLA